MKYLICLLFSISLLGCKGGGGTPATDSAKLPGVVSPEIPEPIVAPVVPPGPVVENVTLTTYSLSLTESPVNGWVTKTYTAVGTCTQYEAKTYCWDDGTQTIDFTSNNFRYGPYTYSFFRLTQVNGSPANCYGGCGIDILTQPTLIEGNVEATINVATVTNVLAHGTPEVANCTKTDNTIDCGDFILEVQ